MKDITPGTQSSSIHPAVVLNGWGFFAADDGSYGLELWKSDGTEEGTVRVKDIRPGLSSGLLPEGMVKMGGALYFPGTDSAAGSELWKSDGTTDGTVLLKNIRPWSASATVQSLTPMEGVVFFTADDGTSGRELWKSDGTEAGTVRVKDIRQGPLGSAPQWLVALNGVLYFVADDGVSGAEIWKSDGTEAGTVRVTDLLPGAASVSPTSLTVSGGRVYFLGDDVIHGRELWVLTPPAPADTVPPSVTCPAPVSAEATSTAGVQVSYPAAEATDDITLSPALSYDIPSGSVFALGETTVTVTAADEAGNTSTCQFTVTVQDSQAPLLTCPDDVVWEATSATGATVSYPAASASDDVSSVEVTYSQGSGTPFAVGTTPVTVTVTDGAGNASTCQFTVTVRDTTAPTIVCPAEVVVEAMGPAGAVAGFVLPQATDAVTASPQVTASPVSGSTFMLGSTPVTLTATDDAGNVGSCQFLVTVRDTAAPVLTCPEEVIVEATGAGGATVSYPAGQAVDVVSQVQPVYSHASGADFPLGGTLVSVTATDAAGNAAACQFTVTVRDTTPPELGCPQDVVLEAEDTQGAVVTFAGVQPRDLVTHDPSIAFSQTSGSRFPLGTTAVAVTASDAAGNEASCRFAVTVQDTTAPQVMCPSDVSVETQDPEGTVLSYAPASAVDGVSSVTVAYSLASGGHFASGTTPVVVTATDTAGNAAQCSFLVSVRVRKPTLIPAPQTGCSSSADAGGPMSLTWSVLVLAGWQVARRRLRHRM